MCATKTEARVVISRDGPYLVTGELPLGGQTIVTDAAGGAESWETGRIYPTRESYALCRCGRSNSRPFCDGSHLGSGFDGTETARRVPYAGQAEVLEGTSGLSLLDVEELCASARFCDPHGKVWNQIRHTDDPEVRARFLGQVGNCPSGRLVAWDRESSQAVEPEFPLSISVVEDPAQDCSGPLWLRGGIPLISSDGFEYEVRNRVTLCRCGASRNKPFCDGSHITVRFPAR